jgi:hypothetical protein
VQIATTAPLAMHTSRNAKENHSVFLLHTPRARKPHTVHTCQHGFCKPADVQHQLRPALLSGVNVHVLQHSSTLCVLSGQCCPGVSHLAALHVQRYCWLISEKMGAAQRQPAGALRSGLLGDAGAAVEPRCRDLPVVSDRLGRVEGRVETVFCVAFGVFLHGAVAAGSAPWGGTDLHEMGGARPGSAAVLGLPGALQSMVSRDGWRSMPGRGHLAPDARWLRAAALSFVQPGDA